MTALAFDPWRTERHLEWRNRVERWRAQPAQTLLHAAAALALVALLVPWLWQTWRSVAPGLFDLIQRWPLLAGVAVCVALTLHQAQRLRLARACEAQHWLRALPIPASIASRRQRNAVLTEALRQAAAGAALSLPLGVPSVLLMGWMICVGAAALLAHPVAMGWTRGEARASDSNSRWCDAGAGTLWRWQKIAATAALRGRTLALGAWFLLLVPMGSGLLGVLGVGVSGLLIAMLTGAWRRSLAVLPQGQAWLGAQPLSGAQWLRQSWFVPATILLAGAGLCAAALLAAGLHPGATAMLLSALIALAALHYACTAAERAQLRRIGLSVCLHLVLLLALAQAFPPLLVPVWVAQMFVLLRRAVRA